MSDDLIRRFYDARARGDRETLQAILHPDVAWHDPYPPPHGGDLHGAEAVFESVFDKAAQLTGGSTRLWLDSVHSTTRHAAAVVGWSSTYRGRSMQSRELAVFAVRDGRIVEAWFYPEDPEAALAFFT